MTSIDVERKAAKEQSIKKKIREERREKIKRVGEERGRWRCERSELITYAKLMCDYFTEINNKEEEEVDGVEKKKRDGLEYEGV